MEMSGGLRLPSLLTALWLCTGCGEAPPEPEPSLPVQIFVCTETLIGLETASCREDVVGPGTLTLAVIPDPKETSWELAIRGLAALAEQCAFQGRFDRTRLSQLQGRGPVDIVCPITPDIDRQYHEIRFENRLDQPNTSIRIELRFER